MNQLVTILQNLQNQPGLLMIVGAAAILSVATAVSGLRSGMIRMLFYFVLAGIMFYFANTLDSLNGEFFLNVGVELLGAVITYILLGDWVTSQAWLFPVIFIITVLSTFTVVLSPTPVKSLALNMSAQLVGTLLILILVKKRNWFWSKRSSKSSSQQLDEMRLRMTAKKEQYLEQWKTTQRQKILQDIEQEMQAWKARSDRWDTAIKIAGSNKRDVQNKIGHLRKTMDNLEILKVDEGDGIIQCYVVGTISSTG